MSENGCRVTPGCVLTHGHYCERETGTLSAPTAAERWRAVPADVRRIVLRWVERGQAQAHRDNVDAYHALVALAREAERSGA